MISSKFKGKRAAFSAISMCAAMAFSAGTLASSSEINSLQSQLDALSKKLDEVSNIKTKGGGLAYSNADGSKTFEVGGRFQMDYNKFNGNYNAGNNGQDGSELFPRRVRTYVEGDADAWDYKLLLDFSEDQGEITMARLRYKGFANGPTVKLGKIREDISLEALTSSKHITGISRPMLANIMSPYFKYGASAYEYFKDTGLRYAVGMYKGAGFGSDGKDETDDLGISYTGRFTWAPVHDGDRVIHLGVWASRRDFGGNELSNKFARGEVRETNVRLVDYAAGGAKYAVDTLDQVGLEFASVYGPLSLQAEYARRDVKAVDSANDDSFDGYYATVSYFLTGEHRAYQKRGVFNSPKPNSGSGAWEVFARTSNFDATSDTQGTEADTFTLGVNFYASKKVKFMANYLKSEVSGPGADALVGTHTDGEAITMRTQYLF